MYERERERENEREKERERENVCNMCIYYNFLPNLY